jgi:hypothetical protein
MKGFIMNLEEKVKNQAMHIKIIEELISKQKAHITTMQSSLEKKNRQLDALLFVWCSGGCLNGIHRYKDIPLTEELVRTAECNTIRLREYLQNYNYRKHDKSYKKVRLYWKIVLWLAGLSWKQWRKKFKKIEECIILLFKKLQ